MKPHLLPTTLAALSLLAATFATPTPALAAGPTEVVITTAAPRWQAKTHAQVVGFRLGTERLYDGVVVLNGGDAPLTEIRIGCVLEATLPGDASPTRIAALTSAPIAVDIAPGEAGVVAPLPWRVDGIIAILIGLAVDGPVEVSATLGVGAAAWADGRRFSRDISNGFRQKPSARLDAAFAALSPDALSALVEAIPSAPSGGPGPARPAGEEVRLCADIDGWMCIVSIATGQCIGSAMAPPWLPASSKCVRVIIPTDLP